MLGGDTGWRRFSAPKWEHPAGRDDWTLPLPLDQHTPRLWAWCQVVTVGGWVRGSPSPGRTQSALELGEQQALEIMFRRGREQTDHLLGKEMRGKQEMETWKGQGPTKFLSRSSCPHPPDGSLLGPSGRKSLHCLSHSPPRSPLSPPF